MNAEIPLRDRLEMLIPPLPWHQARIHRGDGPWVLLLHGLWRGYHAMEPMARALQKAGYSTLNLPYPSTRKSIPDLVNLITRQIETVAGNQPIHAVTHSLGGIIARSALSQSRWNLHRLVMLAPPSQGSEIVDHFKSHHPLLCKLLGPAGSQLHSSGIPSQLPPIPSHIEAAAIMGTRKTIKCFDQLLDSEHDGIVSASRGHLPELKHFSTVDADHTFIPAHPHSHQLCTRFFQTGDWID